MSLSRNASKGRYHSRSQWVWATRTTEGGAIPPHPPVVAAAAATAWLHSRSMSEALAPEEILRTLADPERLAVAGTLAAGPRKASELAGVLDVPLRRVQRHLSRLVGVGLVRIERDRRTYVLVPDALRRAAQES